MTADNTIELERIALKSTDKSKIHSIMADLESLKSKLGQSVLNLDALKEQFSVLESRHIQEQKMIKESISGKTDELNALGKYLTESYDVDLSKSGWTLNTIEGCFVRNGVPEKRTSKNGSPSKSPRKRSK